MLNGLWLSFFLVAAVTALARWLVGGEATVFAAMVESLFAMAKLSVEVMILLFGTVYPVPAWPYNILPYVFLGLLGLGVAYFLILRVAAPDQLVALEDDLLGTESAGGR